MAAFTWVRAVLAHRREAIAHQRVDNTKAEDRARWEGRITAQLETLTETGRFTREALDRIETRLAALPCTACPPERRSA